jgi:hypothetical protein
MGATLAVPVQGPSQVSGVVTKPGMIGGGALIVKLMVVSQPAASSTKSV